MPNIEEIKAIHLVLMIAGNWRAASLVANEKGPWHIFQNFRDKCLEWCEKYPWCAKLHLYELVECEWCNSIWLSLLSVILWILTGDWIFIPLLIGTISTGVIIIKYVVQTLQSIESYVSSLRVKHESESIPFE